MITQKFSFTILFSYLSEQIRAQQKGVELNAIVSKFFKLDLKALKWLSTWQDSTYKLLLLFI